MKKRFSLINFDLQFLNFFHPFQYFNFHAKCLKHWFFLVIVFCRFINKIINFQKKLQLWDGGNCFCHNKHVATIKIIIICASPLITWYIFQIIEDYTFFGVDNLCFEGITCVLVVKWCIIFNHSLNLRKETNNPSFLKNLMKDMI
jgi:hypothetical protein